MPYSYEKVIFTYIWVAIACTMCSIHVLPYLVLLKGGADGIYGTT